MKSGFKFELNDAVVIDASGETGVVIGRGEYSYADSSYLIRYKAGDGRAVEAWWDGGALSSFDQKPELTEQQAA